MESAQEPTKIRLGLCAMAKKLDGKPMKTILGHIENTGHFEIIRFPEKVILQDPVEEWPHPVDFLICFFSDGFPLHKAEAFVDLRKPHLINDLAAQSILLDRRRVYALLAENGIPGPRAVVVERDPETGDLIGDAGKGFVEADDYIIVGENKLDKPFVEKPVDSEDHNICVYYPSSAGGGVKNLFRKIGNKSSEYDPSKSHVRRDGSYMYEPFLQTGGTDIKVYTVGPDYAHAEARKSPVIDGIVNRDNNHKEVRTPVVLTPIEKDIARRVCVAFGQMVCGFDMLRTPTGSYVIDVNGWSFVKGIPKYYEDAGAVLSQHMLHVMGRDISCYLSSSMTMASSTCSTNQTQTASAVNLCWFCPCLRGFATCYEAIVPRYRGPIAHRNSRPNRRSSNIAPRWQNQELLAVLAVMRHGDRTPKNKMKLITRRRAFIQLHENWAKAPNKEAKLKTPKQLQEVLDLCNSMISNRTHRPSSRSDLHDSGSDGTVDTDVDCKQPALRSRVLSFDENEAEAIRLIREVLSEGDRFDGIYRKVQIKPTSWDEQGRVDEVLMILKYGGMLTPAGRTQAETLGHQFRRQMYPGEEAQASGTNPADRGGLLRLHATQRHDFKVYSSDEGRVQMTAAAFAKGLLDLEGNELTPICVALVETNPKMLDDLPADAESLMKKVKDEMHQTIKEKSNASSKLPGAQDFEDLRDKIGQLCKELESIDITSVKFAKCGPEVKKTAESSPEIGKCGPDVKKTAESFPEIGKMICCSSTTPMFIVKRWQKLQADLYDPKKDKWDLSKVPEIYDAIKYDMVHSQGLASAFGPLYTIAKQINDVIVPLEYGNEPDIQSKIGAKVCSALSRKLLLDLQNSVQGAGCELPAWSLVTAEQYLKRSRANSGQSPNPHDSFGNNFASLSSDHADHLLNPTRRVRTRLYFTSESHIQSMMNVLRTCGSEEGERIVSAEAEQRLCREPVFDYLTQIVFRLYEDKLVALESEERYRVEVLFSPGANGCPSAARGKHHVMPLETLKPLHKEDTPLTLACMQKLLEPYAEKRTR